MSLLADYQIKSFCTKPDPVGGIELPFEPMIEPFLPYQIRDVCNAVTKPINGVMTTIPTNRRKVLSYGPVPYGYDVTLSEDFKLFTNINSVVVDPKNLDERCLVDAEVKTDTDGGKYVILPPNSYILGYTQERFVIPNNVTVLLVAKSSYARSGIQINTTIINAGFKGKVVLEIANATNLPVKIYALEGIACALFFHSEMSAKRLYEGLYQGQDGIVLPKV